MGRRKRRAFTPEFKAEAVRLAKASDRSIGEVAKDLDLTETALRDWIKREHCPPAPPSPSEARVELEARDVAALGGVLAEDVEVIALELQRIAVQVHIEPAADLLALRVDEIDELRIGAALREDLVPARGDLDVVGQQVPRLGEVAVTRPGPLPRDRAVDLGLEGVPLGVAHDGLGREREARVFEDEIGRAVQVVGRAERERRAEGAVLAVGLMVVSARDAHREPGLRLAREVAVLIVVERAERADGEPRHRERAVLLGAEAVAPLAAAEEEVVLQPASQAEEIGRREHQADVAIEVELADGDRTFGLLEGDLAQGPRPVERGKELADAHVEIADRRVLDEGVEDGRGAVLLEVVAAEGELHVVLEIGRDEMAARREAHRPHVDLVRVVLRGVRERLADLHARPDRGRKAAVRRLDREALPRPGRHADVAALVLRRLRRGARRRLGGRPALRVEALLQRALLLLELRDPATQRLEALGRPDLRRRRGRRGRRRGRRGRRRRGRLSGRLGRERGGEERERCRRADHVRLLSVDRFQASCPRIKPSAARPAGTGRRREGAPRPRGRRHLAPRGRRFAPHAQTPDRCHGRLAAISHASEAPSSDVQYNGHRELSRHPEYTENVAQTEKLCAKPRANPIRHTGHRGRRPVCRRGAAAEGGRRGGADAGSRERVPTDRRATKMTRRTHEALRSAPRRGA
ncbi:uncharacterized protein SOCE836_076410 [Sorangium cellulosum]|uniref:Transposase n=1 Tax=Sorangium cellulosum TaxID=56 RepID=A0A4P2QY28_SORCE|nr:uncharacterized protein SOCE836_076410 [Sorangium cellulosum]